MTVKSPFLVHQYLLDSAACDRIAKQVRVAILKDAKGVPQSVQRTHDEAQTEVFAAIKPLIPEVEAYFGLEYKGTEPLIFQQFPVTGKLAENAGCQNAIFKRKKWMKVHERDITAVLWLKDYQESPPFNVETQVLGGKLEFPVYNFGFQPQKGTIVFYPACERFISLTTPVLIGELQCVRIHIAANGIWLYDPQNFPGDMRTWFSDVV